MSASAFTLLDRARRQAGAAMDASGLGPRETPWRVVAELKGAQLRAYQGSVGATAPVLLILPAPIKRPYIWDLLPEVSVVRHARERGFAVYLLAWSEPGAAEDGYGLGDYAERLPLAAFDAIAAETGARAALLAGNSLGGTLAAAFASLHPGRVRGLALIDAPLAFGAEGGPLAQAVAFAPSARLLRTLLGSPVPGSALNLLSVAAAPEVFLVQRWNDLAASLGDPLASAVHARVERWALDECAMPGRLFEDVIEQLYREDRFLRGRLEVGGRITGIGRLRCPVLAVVSPPSGVVPTGSVLAGLAALPGQGHVVLRFEGGRGAALQHLGPLVAPAAHLDLWPQILDWAATRWAGPPPREALHSVGP